MRVVTVTPPFFLVTGPASAGSVLTSVLRESGHEAINFDANRFCIDFLLRQTSIERVVQKALPRIQSPVDRTEVRKYLAPKIEDSTESLCGGEAFRCARDYRQAQKDIERALYVHALAHGTSRWSSVEFLGNHDWTKPDELIEAARCGGELFDQPLEHAANVITEYRPGLVGLSVSVPYQLFGALRLAYLLRQRDQKVHLCLGGPTVTRLRESITLVPSLFDLVDSVILREGEAPLRLLAECLKQERDPIERVPGLLGCRDGRVISSTPGASLRASEATFDFRKMPPPVFEDLVPGRHLSPRLLLPVSTTRNCYFDKCDFCAISRSFVRGYREMSPSQIVEQMTSLSKVHDAPLFKDVSEALPPRLLFDLCDEMKKERKDFEWEAYLRFEAPFNSKHAAKRLRQAGLRVAYLGLETASQRLSDKMSKHIDVKAAEQTIRHFADAGIWVHLFLMSGHPNESESDHDATLRFIRNNATYIHSMQAAGFQMELDSNIVQLGDRFGFHVRPRKEPTFSLSVDYEHRGSVPAHATIERRVLELRGAATERPDLTLARSRHVWDGHKIFFTVQQGAPQLPPDKCAELPVHNQSARKVKV